MNKELENLVKKDEFPCVLLGKPAKGKKTFSWVDIDNCGGSKLAIRHLLNQGYRRPVLFVENEETVFDSERAFGYREVLAGKCQIIVHMDEEANLWEKLFALYTKEKMDSAICSNNEIAFRVSRELKQHGFALPDDFGMVTFDNYPLAEYMEPPLSVIDVDTYTLGMVATKQLIAMIQNKKAKNACEIIPTKLIERESTRKRKE